LVNEQCQVLPDLAADLAEPTLELRVVLPLVAFMVPLLVETRASQDSVELLLVPWAAQC
jgi:hypothetical protein